MYEPVETLHIADEIEILERGETHGGAEWEVTVNAWSSKGPETILARFSWAFHQVYLFIFIVRFSDTWHPERA